jgi:GR25 family glycosyltransferase involved in LPS biosynthesis
MKLRNTGIVLLIILTIVIFIFLLLFSCYEIYSIIKTKKSKEKYKDFSKINYGRYRNRICFKIYQLAKDFEIMKVEDSNFEPEFQISDSENSQQSWSSRDPAEISQLRWELNADSRFSIIKISEMFSEKNCLLNNFPCFVVNLDRSQDRLENSIKNFSNIGLTNVIRMRGFDGKTEIPLMKKIFPEFSIRDNPKECNDFFDMISYKNSGFGQQGCTCSHLYIYKYIYENQIPFTAIFEDDVCFHPEFINIFNQTWKDRPKDGDLFNYNITEEENYHLCGNIKTPEWKKFAGASTSFYIITNNGAKRLLKRFSKSYFPCVPCIDDVPFSTLDKSYKLYYKNKGVFKHYPSYCGKRKCGIITTPKSETKNSAIKDVNFF